MVIDDLALIYCRKTDNSDVALACKSCGLYSADKCDCDAGLLRSVHGASVAVLNVKTRNPTALMCLESAQFGFGDAVTLLAIGLHSARTGPRSILESNSTQSLCVLVVDSNSFPASEVLEILVDVSVVTTFLPLFISDNASML
jgi:hypothetical protein